MSTGDFNIQRSSNRLDGVYVVKAAEVAELLLNYILFHFEL
jgi:hypothetical protein